MVNGQGLGWPGVVSPPKPFSFWRVVPALALTKGNDLRRDKVENPHDAWEMGVWVTWVAKVCLDDLKSTALTCQKTILRWLDGFLSDLQFSRNRWAVAPIRVRKGKMEWQGYSKSLAEKSVHKIADDRGWGM